MSNQPEKLVKGEGVFLCLKRDKVAIYQSGSRLSSLEQVKCVYLLPQLRFSLFTASAQRAKLYLCTVRRSRSLGKRSLANTHEHADHYCLAALARSLMLWCRVLAFHPNLPLKQNGMPRKKYAPCQPKRTGHSLSVLRKPWVRLTLPR